MSRCSVSGGSSSTFGGFMVNCGCGVPSKVRTVTKRNHNVGRKFRGCGKFPEADCGYFSWLYDVGEGQCGNCEIVSKRLDEFGKEIDNLSDNLKKMKDKKDVLVAQRKAMVVEMRKENATKKMAFAALVVSWAMFIVTLKWLV